MTVYYGPDGSIEEHHRPHRHPESHRFVHLESQLEHNRRCRSFWQRFLHPGVPPTRVIGGNEYTVNQLDQRRLLPFSISAEDEVAAAAQPRVHLPAEENPAAYPQGPEAANVSLHSTDSGIVAGLGAQVSQV